MIICPIDDLYEWIDIRDFSPFGGKTVNSGKNNLVSTTQPYLFPWSMGESASLNLSPKLFTISKQMIYSFKKILFSYECMYKTKLTFRDLIKSKFPIPTTSLKMNLPLTINTYVSEYLDIAMRAIDEEQQRNVYIFDMDGTLYSLDGKSGGYIGSSLEENVRNNALRFIAANDSCSIKDAVCIYQEGLTNPTGVSKYLSDRYGLTRRQYFDVVWNINPEGIVVPNDAVIQKLLTLSSPKNKLVLLTSSPKIWVNKVISKLNLENAFELLYSGEQFASKQEIFTLFAQWYLPKNVTSIGDQEDTDLKPARSLGMNTILISNNGSLNY